MRGKFIKMDNIREMDRCTKALFVTTFIITVLELLFYLVIPICGQIILNLNTHLPDQTGTAIWWFFACFLMLLVVLDFLFLLRRKQSGKLAKFCLFTRLVKGVVIFAILGYFIYLNITLIKPNGDPDWVRVFKDTFPDIINQNDKPEVKEAKA